MIIIIIIQWFSEEKKASLITSENNSLNTLVFSFNKKRYYSQIIFNPLISKNYFKSPLILDERRDSFFIITTQDFVLNIHLKNLLFSPKCLSLKILLLYYYCLMYQE